MKPTKLICYVVGCVFLVSGLMKFVDLSMVSSFEQMGVPLSNYVYFFVALFEVMAGLLLIGRIFIHICLIPLIFILLGALFFTKLPLLSGDGVFAFLFASRLDLTLLILLLFLWTQRKDKEAFT
ncbi:DoxX family protein [Oceanobacillus jeddahense]|uniref:DoxX family protein n=1 Tax=Oceanobacillus jeddahense TaxID=1462527 RepID=A0ABY5JRZ6_9BACI|nr:DoxX family protein [Oceanobacillus jeddahense]UUI03103.1 DoxX family protein [Oceanobacillus jeddahense]